MSYLNPLKNNVFFDLRPLLIKFFTNSFNIRLVQHKFQYKTLILMFEMKAFLKKSFPALVKLYKVQILLLALSPPIVYRLFRFYHPFCAIQHSIFYSIL